MTTTLDVVAVAARTPLGATAPATAAAVRAGVAGFAEFPFAMFNGEPVIVCADGEIASALEGHARIVPMIESVLGEAIAALGDSSYRGRCYLLLALPETRPGFSEADAAAVSEKASALLRTHLPDVRAGVVGRGHAGAIRAVERVAEETAKGTDGLFIIVGADSYHHPDTFVWLENDKRFAQPNIRSGFIPGEGAGCLVLATPELSGRLGLPVTATVTGVGTAQESLLRDSETGSFGKGMIAAVEAAVEGLRLPHEGADTVYADINGERYRSEEWGFVAMHSYQAMKSLEYELPGSCWGDVGAAFAPLAAVLAVQSHARRYAKGPRALVMAGSDSGLRGAMVIHGPMAG